MAFFGGAFKPISESHFQDPTEQLRAQIDQLRIDPNTPQAKYGFAEDIYRSMGFRLLPKAEGRPQDRVYQAVANALVGIGRQETVKSLRQLAVERLLALPMDHEIRQEFIDTFPKLVSEVSDSDDAILSGAPVSNAKVELTLLAEALNVTIHYRYPEFISGRNEHELRGLTLPIGVPIQKQPGRIFTILQIDDDIIQVVKRAIPATAATAVVAARPLLNLSAVEVRHQAIRADFLRCRSDEERRAFVQRIREAERARDIGRLVTHADWQAHAKQVAGAPLFRTYGEIRCIAANYTALQAARYYIAKIGNGIAPKECMGALLQIFIFRKKRGDTEEALLSAFHEACMNVPRETCDLVLEAVRTFTDASHEVGALASRMGVIHFFELHDLSAEMSLEKFLTLLIQRFGKSSTEADRKYHIMALFLALAKSELDMGAVGTVVATLQDMKKTAPDKTAAFVEALGVLWLQLMENQGQVIEKFFSQAIQGGVERTILTDANLQSIKEKVLKLLADFKPTEFAEKLSEAVSVAEAKLS